MSQFVTLLSDIPDMTRVHDMRCEWLHEADILGCSTRDVDGARSQHNIDVKLQINIPMQIIHLFRLFKIFHTYLSVMLFAYIRTHSSA